MIMNDWLNIMIGNNEEGPEMTKKILKLLEIALKK